MRLIRSSCVPRPRCTAHRCAVLRYALRHDALLCLQFLVLCILKGLFAALCCLKSFNWEEIMKGARSNAYGGAAGSDDPSVVQPRVPSEHTPLTKVL